MPSFLASSRTFFRNSGVDSSASPRFLRCALSAVRRKVMVATPGISSGYWKARNRPRGGALVGLHVEQVLAVEQHLACGRLVVRLAGEHIGERRLARAVRPHDRVHLARVHREVETLRISLPSISTCRFLISSNAIKLPFRTLRSAPAPTPVAVGLAAADDPENGDHHGLNCEERDPRPRAFLAIVQEQQRGHDNDNHRPGR